MTLDTATHPRNAATGRFVDAVNSIPETGLRGDALHRSTEVQAAIDAVTHGHNALARAIGSGRFGFAERTEARENVWVGAGGPPSGSALKPHLDMANVPLDADAVERILEVTFYRAHSRRYALGDDGDLFHTGVDPDELRAGDYQAEARGLYVTEQWDAGLAAGPEAEISEHNARLFAEDAIASLGAGITIVNLPRLAEFAYRPYSEAAGASPWKVDAFHRELAAVRASHNYLSPRERVRLDVLATYAMHALPGHN